MLFIDVNNNYHSIDKLIQTLDKKKIKSRERKSRKQQKDLKKKEMTKKKTIFSADDVSIPEDIRGNARSIRNDPVSLSNEIFRNVLTRKGMNLTKQFF